MAKKYIIYASGKDLAAVPVTQNEIGVYYRNSAGTYYKPVLADFDTANPPVGYKKYTNGSHLKYATNVNRNPIDFSIIAGANLTMNVDVTVLGSNPGDGSWCKVQPVGSSLVIALVHTYQWRTGVVKAGNIICKIAPQSVTGFAPHLHLDEWSNKGYKIRDLVLNGNIKMGNFKIGTKIEFTAIQNIRSGSGTSYRITGQTKVGQLGVIKDGPRVADGYTWWDIQFEGGGTGWVAEVGKFKVYVAPVIPPVIEPPVGNCDEYIKQVKLLQTEIEALKNDYRALQGVRDSLEQEGQLIKERNTYLEGVVKNHNNETAQLEGEIVRLQDDLKKEKQQYMLIVEELNELKRGRDTWLNRLADMLHKLFSGAK